LQQLFECLADEVKVLKAENQSGINVYPIDIRRKLPSENSPFHLTFLPGQLQVRIHLLRLNLDRHFRGVVYFSATKPDEASASVVVVLNRPVPRCFGG
jgi:hypothetical protein